MGPLIVVKRHASLQFRIVRLSEQAFAGAGVAIQRITDIDYPYHCLDQNINRSKFYKAVIDQMIDNGFAIAAYQENQVTNTLHDNIVNFCANNRLKIIKIDLTMDEFPF